MKLEADNLDLVVQGATLQDEQARILASLSAAIRWQRLGPQAARLLGVTQDDRVQAACEDMQLDLAYVPADRRLIDFGLVAFDMDSTLITIECIDELADIAGVGAQVAEITRSAMRGDIAFAESLRRRVALLKGLDAGAFDRVYNERLQLSPGAERMVQGLKRAGIRTQLVSGGFTYFTDRLRDRLGLDYACSTEPEIQEGRFTGRVVGKVLDAQGKAEQVRATRERLGLAPERVITIGDGANDLAMMAEAGVSIAYRAKPVVRARATYSFNHVGLDGLLNLYP